MERRNLLALSFGLWLWSGFVCSGFLLAQEPFVTSQDALPLVERLATIEAELEALRMQVSTPQERDVEPAAGYSVPPAPGLFGGVEPHALPSMLTPPAPPPPVYPTVKVNGFFQADMGYFGQSDENRRQLGDIQDGADFRRFRLSASGAVASNVNYMAQLDFGFFGRPTFTDVWGEVTDVPYLGTVRVGQWKQPFGLEVVTSVRYQTFLERSLLFQTITAFRHIGAGFYNNSEDLNTTWSLSGFRVGNDQFGNDIGDNGGWSTAGRLTHLMYYHGDSQPNSRLEYLHLGGAFWLGDPGNDRFRYATIPEAYIGAFGVPAGQVPGTSGVQVPSIANGTPPFVDTGFIPTNTFVHLGGEALWAHGPWSWQSELQMATVSQIGGPQLNFWGFYSQWMWMLTGESRPYLRKIGAMDRIVPFRPFLRQGDCQTGYGAWELAARVSYLDLDDANIRGGRLTDFTAGLNWYLNGYTKLQLNYIHAMLDRDFNNYDGKSNADIYLARMQLDF